jgi:hypothetical protein
MRSRAGVFIACLSSVAALSMGASNALAGTTQQSKSGGTCKFGISLGSSSYSYSGPVKCSKPAGKGTTTGQLGFSPTSGTFYLFGTFHHKFKTGTISGIFEVSGTAPPSPGSSLKGQFAVTKATGKLKSAAGSGKMTCTLSSTSPTINCTQSWTRGSV